MKVEKIKRKKGIRYRSRFMVNYRSFKSPWSDSEKDAKEWAIRKQSEILAGQENFGAPLPLEDFAKLWFEKHVDANKVYSSGLRDKQVLRRHVLPILGRIKLTNLKTSQIEFLLSDIKREGAIKPKTINNLLGTIKKMLNDAVRWGYLHHNPAQHIKPMKVVTAEVKVFFDSELSLLLPYLKDFHPSEYQLVVFALNTGCRLGECLALLWNKVDLTKAIATIDATYEGKERRIVARTKGKRFRKVPLNQPSLGVLRELHLAMGERSDSPIFTQVDYNYLTHEKFKRILNECGLHNAIERGATFHTLRHTFASEFMRQGGSLYDLQHILGHSSITQTEKYSHFAPDHLAGLTSRVSFAAHQGEVIPLTRQKLG